MIMRVQNLTWKHKKQIILDNVSLGIKEGETFGLIGPNGSGKSTLLRIIAGVLKPTHGTVQLADRPLSQMKQREIARILAFVAQQAETNENINVRDAVELGRTPWLSPLRPFSDEDNRHVDIALQTVGMTHFSTRNWANLSGGERQRVHIARALAQAPQVLLLDEPTNHLDIHHQIAILALIRQLNMTTVIALHDLNQALSCDRLAVMHGGKLVAIGNPSDILTKKLLRNVFTVEASELIDPADGSRVLRFTPIA